MPATSLLACLLVLWLALQAWVLPLIRQRWQADDLRGKAARAGTLVVAEKLRDIAAAGTCALAMLLMFVAAAQWLGHGDVQAPKQVIEGTAWLHAQVKRVADGFGSATTWLGIAAATLLLWRAARGARERVHAVWSADASARFEALRQDPVLREQARSDPTLRPLVEQLDAAVATAAALQPEEGAQSESPAQQAARESHLREAHQAVGQALSALAVESARLKLDFAAAVGASAPASAPSASTAPIAPPTPWQRLRRVLVSKKLGDDLGLARKRLGWLVSALLFASLLGWMAEPLADSLRLAVNNLRVNLLAEQTERDMQQALSQASAPAPDEPTPPAPQAQDVARAAQLLARATLPRLGAMPLHTMSGGAQAMRQPGAAAEFVRAALAEHQLGGTAAGTPAERLRVEVAQAMHSTQGGAGAATGHAPASGSIALEHLEQAVQSPLRELQRRDPSQLARLVQQLEARYAAPMNVLDAQGKLMAKVMDEAFTATQLAPEGELARQAQKLAHDAGKDATKTWANAKVKELLTQTLTGIARPPVQMHMSFELSNAGRELIADLQHQEGRGWQSGGAAAREAQMSARVAEKVAELHTGTAERAIMRERLGGYEQLFAQGDRAFVGDDVPHSTGASGGGGGGGGGGKPGAAKAGGMGAPAARASSFKVAARSFRVRGVLVGQAAVGQPLDATDLRWRVTPSPGAGVPSRVALELRLASAPGRVPQWQPLGSFSAGVLNQGLRYAGDGRFVATTITPGDGKAIGRQTYLHPALLDTPLGCRIIESDRWVDTFTFSEEAGSNVLARASGLTEDRVQMGRWLGFMRLAEAVAGRGAERCPTDELRKVLQTLGPEPIRFSNVMSAQMSQFIQSRRNAPPAQGAALLDLAATCLPTASAPADRAGCLCEKVAAAALPTRYWFPQDHTSQVREREARLDASLAWLRPTSNRLGHLDFWTHTTFALVNSETREVGEDEKSTAALDFAPAQLAALRQIVLQNLPRHAARQGASLDDLTAPLEEFVLAQRLARAALQGQLGPDFPLVRLLELERATRPFVATQTTLRWEPAKKGGDLGELLKQADPAAHERYAGFNRASMLRAYASLPQCSAASK